MFYRDRYSTLSVGLVCEECGREVESLREPEIPYSRGPMCEDCAAIAEDEYHLNHQEDYDEDCPVCLELESDNNE